MTTIQLDETAIAALEREALDNGVLKVMPSAFYREFDQESIFGFCVRNGLYGLPTVELINTLNDIIQVASPSQKAIEIGSGCGVLGEALGIPCTDSYLQYDLNIRAIYKDAYRQSLVKYGPHVECIEANAAVDFYRPDVVVSSWVTHLYGPGEDYREGNMFGVDEDAILSKVKRYLMVGNLSVHAKKPLLKRPHKVIHGDFLFSKSMDTNKNAIFIWDR